MQASWQQFFTRPNKKLYFFGTLFLLALVLVGFVYFLTFNEDRIGYKFSDPLLALFQPIPLSEIIFFLTYFFSVYGIIKCFREPALFLSLIQAYILLTLMRMFCMYLLPLEPPNSIMPLRDTFLQSTFYSGRANLKDLFFSGHTATIFLFVFVLRSTGFKILFALGGFAVGVMLVLQHVHYSIDVIAAPIFSYLAVRLQRKVDIQ